MRFTQFLFPNRRRSECVIDMPQDIEALADALVVDGWRFEIECFPDTQLVHMDCSNDDEALSVQICQNGPRVPETVKLLVTEATLAARQKAAQR